MRSNRNGILIAVGLLLAGLISLSSACARDHRQGATEINQRLSGSPGPVRMNPYSADGAAPFGAGTPAPAPSPNAGAPARSDNVSVSQSIADAVSAMNEVKSANVLVAGRSAYVAVVLHYGSSVSNAADPKTNNRQIVDVSDEVKTKIAATVKQSNPQIDNVYVSANPDFVERVNVYAQDIRNGKPVSGFIKEFYNLVERMFPYRAGAANNPPAAR